MTRCLDDVRLERLLRGTAPRVRGWFWRRHMRSCPGCRARYAELEADRRLVGELRAALRGPPAESGTATVPHRPDASGPPADPGTLPEMRGTAASPEGVATAVPGTLPDIPGYVVEAEIGRGGMGVVYRARHLRLNRPAAIKMILGGKYHDPTARVRFLVEAEAVAALDHPHVVHVHEFGTHDGLPYFALEFVGGGTLAEKLRRDGKPPPRAAAELVMKLADGIAAAHARGIVHRDLKPANVLLTESGEPKVTDFGLAKVGQSDVTATGAVMGTPSYMSPEQAAGRTREVGTHSDTYALGAILYELLTGRPAFSAESSMATIQQVLTREPERPRAIDAAIPRDLETIALKCLAKEPGKRYPTASELAADLRAYLDGRPIAARPAGTAERAWKWVRRNPAVTGAAAAVVLALTAGTTVSYLKYRDAEEQKGIAEGRRAEAEVKEREARQEAAKAERASAYLVSIFDLAGAPGRRSTTPRQILDEAEKEIPNKFADQPELRDRLLKQIGEVYDRMTANAPLAMLLEVSGAVRLESARDPTRPPVPQTLLYAGDRLTLGSDGRVWLVSLSDLHQERLGPNREVTVRRKGCEPAAAVVRDAGVPMTFVQLKKGTFHMGWDSTNKSAKKMEIKKDFEIAVHDVTQGQWEAVMDENPSYFSRFGMGSKAVQNISDEELKLFPVESVSWHDVQEFIKRLNEKERDSGWVYRLPTEAEWEYACRGGATTEYECCFDFYLDKPRSHITSTEANFNGDPPGVTKAAKGPNLQRTTRVGAYPPNKRGLCDMHGNVWQWTSDVSDRTGAYRVFRGGGWSSDVTRCRAASREWFRPTDRFATTGFRLVRVQPQ